jgi:predicted transcriptional regulator
MDWLKHNLYKRTVRGSFLIVGILLISVNLTIIDVITAVESEKGKIAVFYGSTSDERLSYELVGETGRIADYYNITKIHSDPTFMFESDSIAAVWWISELPIHIDLTFLGNLADWKQRGRGLFVVTRYFNETPLQELAQLGITAYAPVVYPLNGSYLEQELNLVEDDLPSINLTKTVYAFNGSTAWVDVNNQTQMLAEVTPPEVEPVLGDLRSGIWLLDKRVIVCSFSVKPTVELEGASFSLHGTESTTSDDMTDLLAQFAQMTLGDLSSGSAINLSLASLDQLATFGLVILAGLVTIFIMIKLGIASRIREILVGVFMSMILFIAHITYSPQRRRLSETELLENKLRNQIVDYLELKGEQGAHLREIQREVGCGISSLLWHLQALDDFNVITHEKIGKYHIFYLIGVKSIEISEIALALKSDVAKELCRVLIRNRKPLSLANISQEIDVHHSSVQHHIKRLVELGLIITLQDKKRLRYIIGSKRFLWLKSHLEVS